MKLKYILPIISNIIRIRSDRLSIISLLFVSLILIPSASASWWNSSWSTREAITITTNGNSTPAWYQVPLNITYTSPMQTDFDDIRFTNSTNGLLAYWIESKVNNSYANVWVNLSDAITNPGSDTIYMYYGNAVVSDGGVGEDTFVAWHGNSVTNYNDSQKITLPYIYQALVKKTSSGDSPYFGTGDRITSDAGNATYMAASSTGDNYFKTFLNGAQSYGHVTPTFTNNTYYNIKIIVASSTSAVFSGDGGLTTQTLTSNIPTIPLGLVMLTNPGEQQYSFARKYIANEPTVSYGSAQYISSWSNNWTNDNSTTFQTLTTKTVKFNFTAVEETTYKWWVNTDVQSSTSTLMNYTFATAGTYYVNSSATTKNVSNNWTVYAYSYNLEALTPTNGSTGVSPSPVTFTWREWETDLPHTLYIYTDNQFINLVSTSTISSGTNENFTTNISGLSENTQYFWRVKNNSGYYTSTMNFTTTTTAATPGRFNISVLDGSNLSLMILNYTISLYNSTHTVSKNSNTTTGWCNFSTEIASGEYLIIVDPTGIYNNYYQRMVLADSPGNVTMYVPNSTEFTIDSVSFALLDVTGRFPFQTSTITVSRGGLVRDKSYFGLDGTHIVHLTHGKNYQITIQNGDNIFSFDNYLAYATGTSQITINDFTVNTTLLDPFRYNITTSPTVVTLNWNDVGGVLSSLNFTVRNLTSGTQICNLVTSVGHGQSVCGINNQAAFQTIFSAKLTDGTFMNQTLYIDYTTGVRKSTTGTSPIDGSPMGIGFKFDYGTFTMPDYVYTWISLILFVLLMGTFGAQFSGFGAIIAGAEMLFFEYVGWFNPLGDTDPSNVITMGLTGVLTIFAVLYFMQHRERGG